MLEELHIYETYNGGAIYKVSVRDSEGEWHKIWAGTPHHVTQSRIFKPPLQVTTSKREDGAEALKKITETPCSFSTDLLSKPSECV